MADVGHDVDVGGCGGGEGEEEDDVGMHVGWFCLVCAV